MRIGFLGFGEAARAFQDSLKAADPALRFSAWDILLLDEAGAPAMRAAMQAGGVEETGPEGLCEADWVVSAVTADQSLLALESIAPHLVQGQLVVDINSVSPGRKRDSAALTERAGAHYLDMAVMAPVHPRGHRTPVLLAGGGIEVALGDLERLGFDFREVGAEAGQATAIKMVRSLFVKGLEAVTVEALLAAKASGCFEEIVQSLSASYPGLGWPDFASYEFERTLRHGTRRAAEMRESAATVSELGLNGALAGEIAEVQERMGALGLAGGDAPLDELVGAVLSARLARN
ncbi:MAG: NAD(P)-dependent oxidoreductase [Brucellaceae bacterium]|nr:NAD(P)-dependent oxidoreductase [Brucellaceae bacterium]